MTSVDALSAGELAALLHFYADAGVNTLVENEPVDRFAEFQAMQQKRQADRPAPQATPPAATAETRPAARNLAASGRNATPAPVAERPVSTTQPAIPDDQAVAQARFAAESARSLDELRTALEAFTGCNLKNSARSTIFASGDPSGGIMIIGPMPNADDDRDGQPFAGRAGQLLDKMLAAIGLARDRVMLTNVLPWRPPGNRMPSQPELDICRPFIERQLALAEPKSVLLLGNFSARFFFGGQETIHATRGQWRDISAGQATVPAIASLHPLELITAPANKRLAWADLLMFRAGPPGGNA